MIGDRKQIIKDFKSVFDNPTGKRVLDHLISKTTLKRTVVAKTIDTNRLLYDEGQRVMMLYILKMINTNPYEQRQEKAKE